MFLQNAKNDITNCMLNLQKSRSEILITGNGGEKMEAARLKRQLEEVILIVRNLGLSLDKIIQAVPSREQIIHQKKAGDEASQKQEGLTICIETIKKIKKMDGVRGLHILSGGKENLVSEIIALSDL